MAPIIGITPDTGRSASGALRYEVASAYCSAIAAAGGSPLVLPHIVERIDAYVRLCAGFVFTGGDDPATEAFGEATHPRARRMDAQRQAFELALLAAIDARKPTAAVLGVCLGMQLMALHAGGRLHQHLPDVLGQEAASLHLNNREHAVRFDDGRVERVISHHHQAVADAGAMKVVARACDGVIEAIAAPDRPMRVGVQWHPERMADDGGLFARLVAAAAAGA